jgi:hypothetical protein
MNKPNNLFIRQPQAEISVLGQKTGPDKYLNIKYLKLHVRLVKYCMLKSLSGPIFSVKTYLQWLIPTKGA